MAGKPRQRIGATVVQIPSLCRRPLARCVHMSHRVSMVIRPEHAESALAGISRGIPADNTPIETYSRGIGKSREEIR